MKREGWTCLDQNGYEEVSKSNFVTDPPPWHFSARHSKEGGAIAGDHTLYHQKDYIVRSSKL